MQCILSALKAESDPLINYFQLKRDPSFQFPVFVYNDLYLIGIGIGKVKVQERIYLFLETARDDFIQFINIGIAGGKDDNSELGQVYLINKIVDDDTDHSYYPDILIRHSLSEHSVTTVNKGIMDGGNRYKTLVDMEASEIFKICSKKIPVHRLAFLKIVSDYMDLDTVSFNTESISSLITPNLKSINSFLDRFKTLQDLEQPILSNSDCDWIILIKNQLGLTESQYQQLIRATKGFRLRNPELLCPELQAEMPESKFNRNQIFKTLCDKLST
jgi:hypothetical protein